MNTMKNKRKVGKKTLPHKPAITGNGKRGWGGASCSKMTLIKISGMSLVF